MLYLNKISWYAGNDPRFWPQVQNFGEPFFLVIHEGETLAEVKVRIQKKLQVPDEEFAKVSCTLISCPYLCPYLLVPDIIHSLFFILPFDLLVIYLIIFAYLNQWKFAFLSLGRPEYLHDTDIVSSRFQVIALFYFQFPCWKLLLDFSRFIFTQRRDVYGAWEQYLGLEHADTAPKRSYTVNQVRCHLFSILFDPCSQWCYWFLFLTCYTAD